MDMTWFDELEAKIPKGTVRTRFARRPPDTCTWQSPHRLVHLAHRPESRAANSSSAWRTPTQTRQVEGHGAHLPYHGRVRIDPRRGPRCGWPGGAVYPDPAPGALWQIRRAAGGERPRLLLLLRESGV